MKLFQSLQDQSYRFFTVNDPGIVMSRMNNDVNEIRGMIRTSLVDILSYFFLIISSVVLMIALHWQVALILIGTWPLVFLIAIVNGKLNAKVLERCILHEQDTGSFIFDRLNGNCSELMREQP